MAGDDYLPALPWFDNADLNKRTELTIMKIERTAVIAAMSVIVGLGIVGISPAFATDWNTFNSANSALKSGQDWEYNDVGFSETRSLTNRRSHEGSEEFVKMNSPYKWHH